MKRQLRRSKQPKSGFLILLMLFLGSLGATAQGMNVTGTVSDSEGSALPGASITVKNSSNGTITNADGKFSINAKQGDILVCSFIGYQTQEVAVSGAVANFTLATSENSFDEVVVVGYGTRRKSDLTGSISQVSSKDYKEQPVTRIEDALQGRAAGVNVSRTSGSPGGDVKVRIRGVNSITGNNDPLVVIDGIIGGDLGSLNPNDIESMEVLKDASATAIYGSRGSNGVILVSTKKGTEKGSLDVEFFTGFSKIPKFIETLSAADFAVIENQRRISSGGASVISDSEISALRSSGGTDYQREVMQTGVSQNFQLSTSGKAGKVSYFMSGNYMNQNGVLITTNYKRLSGRVNLNSEITKKLRIGFNLFGTNEKNHNNIDDTREYQGSMFVRALTWDPTTPIYNYNGDYNNFSNRAFAHLGYNPIAAMNLRDNNRNIDKINANLNISYDILDNLNYTIVGGAGSTNNTNESYRTDPPFPNAGFGTSQSQGIQMSNILTWSKTMGIHDLKLTGVYEIQQGVSRFNGYNANNMIVPGGFYLAELNSATGISNDYSKSGIESYMARAEYILKDNLLVTGTVRRDRSSRFREGKDVGIFPSVALAYNLGNLSFIQNSPVFTSLKLRAGWGQVGNQNVAPYVTYPSVNINRPYLFNGGTLTPGSSPGGYGNPDLTWETTTQTNVGFDLGLFNQRVNLTVDAYQKNTSDLLLQVPVPDFAGGGSILKNVGEVENKGLDIGLDGVIVNNNDFRWNSTLTASFVKNKVSSLFDGRTEIIGSFNNIDGSGRALNIIQLDQPIGQFYGETFLGTWKTSEAEEAKKYGLKPGDAKYLRDAEGNIVLGAIGNGTPTLSWGFNNTFSYKGFDANIFFTGMGGFEILNVVDGILVGATGNQRSFMSPVQLDQWTPENETDIPAGGQNRTASSRYVEKGDFARLSNLSIGYTIKSIPNISSAKVYVSGQNLLLLTQFSGYDPEGSDRDYDNGNNDTAAGVNVGAYPNARVITVGIKIGL
ncbi:MAG: TonB-dependent receptor [Cytophagales bacterium]|nr:TonB-dependent receptor [Cytophagales bacterium]